MSKKQPLINAGEIIERFGGIRPMAAKIDTPVTTVQGWKKRDVIPGTRRVQILSAASEYNIDISDLVEAAVSNENVSKTLQKAPNKKPNKSAVKKKSSVKKSQPQKVEKQAGNKSETITSEPLSAVSSNEEKSQNSSDIPKIETIDATATKPSVHDELISEIEQTSRKNIAMSAWVATGFILLTIAVGVFLLWPNFKNNQEKLEAQSQQIVELEDKVEAVKDNKKFLGTHFPEDLQKKIDGLQGQARNISVTVDQLSERAKAISRETLGDSTASISTRLESLEQKIGGMSGPDGSFSGLVARIRDLEDSVAGQVQLENSANQLRLIVGSMGSDVDGDLVGVQTDEDGGALGRTLDGVSGQNLKAAAILIAFSQLRSSLEREAPFEDDLALLQGLVGDDNPELQDNLTRLAPYADGGVLTSSGLSSELKKLTGDIVVSSLKGEDVSIKEKAKARFGAIIQVEKDGEMVSGTQTQATVAKAQEYVEQGKIEDSISALQGLDGEAAVAAQPFIDKAQASLLAEKVKTMLSESILSKAGVLSDAPMETLNNLPLPDVNNIDVDGIKQELKEVVPFVGGNEIVKDKESGIVILPRNEGFKGFSGGE